MRNSFSFLECSVIVNREKPSGFIMLENTPVVKITDGESEVIDNRAPLFFHAHRDFERWCESRCVDLTRKSPRVFKKMLNLKTSNEMDIVLSVYARTITDRYWFKPEGSTKKFSDVMQFSSELCDTALDGKFIELDGKEVMTPELTNIGSFEKCWMNVNGKWTLVKKGTKDELFSEYLIYLICDYLGLPTANYRISSTKNRIMSEDFTKFGKVTYEPMSSITESEDYVENLKLISRLTNNTEIVKQFMNILFMDTICFNVDRHLDNYGLLREIETGEIISMAPNYDNNLSLISRERRTNCITPSLLIDLFVEATKCFHYELPVIEFNKVGGLIKKAKNSSGSDVDESYVLNFIKNSYQELVRRSN